MYVNFIVIFVCSIRLDRKQIEKYLFKKNCYILIVFVVHYYLYLVKINIPRLNLFLTLTIIINILLYLILINLSIYEMFQSIY